MQTRQETTRTNFGLGLMALAGLARILPHPPNFTPVSGMSLYAGARLRRWQAYLAPLIVMSVTDVILSFMFGYPIFTKVTPAIYGSFLISVWIGRCLRENRTALRIGAAAGLCSAQFFLLTNFAVWFFGHLYPHSVAGLALCYVAALPFFGRTLAGDLLYTAALFGLDALIARWTLRAEPAGAPAV